MGVVFRVGRVAFILQRMGLLIWRSEGVGGLQTAIGWLSWATLGTNRTCGAFKIVRVRNNTRGRALFNTSEFRSLDCDENTVEEVNERRRRCGVCGVRARSADVGDTGAVNGDLREQTSGGGQQAVDSLPPGISPT